MKSRFEKMLLTDDEVNNQLLLTQNQSQDELFRLLCTTIKYSGFFEWNIVYKSFNNTNDLNYRKILLRSLGCSREISLINSYINFLVQKEFYTFTADILTSISQNKIGMKYVLDYLSINWKKIKFDIKQLSVIFKNISNENEYKVVSLLFSLLTRLITKLIFLSSKKYFLCIPRHSDTRTKTFLNAVVMQYLENYIGREKLANTFN